MMRNWKTTLMGIFGIVSVIAKIATTKTMGPEDFTSLTVSAGLIMAKDHNISGIK
jgi:uncharacterized membrane protein YdcZ (DUF606 family)